MRVFVTGASGWIGSAVVPDLIAAGHQVTGLARSDASAETLAAAGAEVQRGDLEDLDGLRAGAAASDGVIHLAFIHDFSRFANSLTVDQRAIEAIGAALEGSDRPLVIASGTLGLAQGRAATEEDRPDAGSVASPRGVGAEITLGLASHGVRSCVLRLPPTVHGDGDHGFMAALIGIARERGVSGYIGDGSNRWSAVHRFDAARLFRLAAEAAPAGSVLHAVDDEGVPIHEIAAVIGRHLDLPVVSVPADEAVDHFGWLGRFLGADATASSALTRERMGWTPSHPGLIEDLAVGHYFTERPA
jgi:nucleoside-diphosphate-sugar epimerase